MAFQQEQLEEAYFFKANHTPLHFPGSCLFTATINITKKWQLFSWLFQKLPDHHRVKRPPSGFSISFLWNQGALFCLNTPSVWGEQPAEAHYFFFNVLLLPLSFARMVPTYRMGPLERDEQVRTPDLLTGSLESWGPTVDWKFTFMFALWGRVPSVALCCDGLPRKQG